MTVALRRTVTNGWRYDFNYTLSHAIDNKAYNLLNHENFRSPTLTIAQLPVVTTAGIVAAFGNSRVGQITQSNPAGSPRVLQMALRLTF